MKSCCLAVLLMLLVALPACAQESKGKDSIEGAWSLTGSTTPGGKKIPAELIAQLMGGLTLSKDGNYEQTAAGTTVEAGKYKIDAAKKPAWIDLEPADGPNKGKKQLGIVKIEAGELTVALGKVGSGVRPKDFKDARKAEVSTYKRAE
jgi:uncharacterized protein (TIGR03067 family)